MARTFIFVVDKVSPAGLARAVVDVLGGEATLGRWQPMAGGRWLVDGVDADDAVAYDFAASAEVVFEVNALAANEAEQSVARAVIAILTAHDVNAWLGFEGSETLRRLEGKLTRASRRLWGELADTLNKGLAPAA